MLQRRFLVASLLDFEASWRVFLATFAILPVFAAPMPCCQLAGWLTITPVSSSKATPTRWVIFFDGHIWIAISYNLALPILARSDNKFLALSRCTPWAVARQFSRIHHLPHRYPRPQDKHRGATVVPSGGFQRSLTAS